MAHFDEADPYDTSDEPFFDAVEGHHRQNDVEPSDPQGLKILRDYLDKPILQQPGNMRMAFYDDEIELDKVKKFWEEFSKKYQAGRKREGTVNIPVVGLSQSGKSKFINFLLSCLPFQGATKMVHRARWAEEGKGQFACTKNLSVYEKMYDGVVFRFIDTPGLLDDKGAEKDKENTIMIVKYLRQFKELHGMILVNRFNHTLTQEAQKSLNVYMKLLEPLRNQTILVLTRANTDSDLIAEQRDAGEEIVTRTLQEESFNIARVLGLQRIPTFPFQLKCRRRNYDENVLHALQRYDNMQMLFSGFRSHDVSGLWVHKTPGWKLEDEHDCRLLKDRNKTVLRAVENMQQGNNQAGRMLLKCENDNQVLSHKLSVTDNFLRDYDTDEMKTTGSVYIERAATIGWRTATTTIESMSQVELEVCTSLAIREPQSVPVTYDDYTHATTYGYGSLTVENKTNTSLTVQHNSDLFHGLYSKVDLLAPSNRAYREQIMAVKQKKNELESEMKEVSRVRQEVSDTKTANQRELKALRQEIEENARAIMLLELDPIRVEDLDLTETLRNSLKERD